MKISLKLFRNPDLDFYLHYLEILMWFLNILKFLFNYSIIWTGGSSSNKD